VIVLADKAYDADRRAFLRMKGAFANIPPPGPLPDFRQYVALASAWL